VIQAYGSIVQIAYVVENIASSARAFSETMGVGPFFLFDPIEIVDPRYKGEPTDMDISLAIGYSGGVSIELIKVNSTGPSVYETAGVNGFHHLAIMSEIFDEELGRYQQLGYDCVFSGSVAVGARFAYMHTLEALGGMVELIEVTPAVKDFFALLEGEAVGWKGNDHLRTLA